MGKQCVVIAVLFSVVEDGNAVWIIVLIEGVWITTKHACLRVNSLILYVSEAFPESNGAGLVREWAGWIVISIFVAINARYIGLVFYDGLTGHRMQANAVLGV